MLEEYYINQGSCRCSNSPYFLINNPFRELDTEKRKRIARLNLGIISTDNNVKDLIEFIGKDKELLVDGIYYYYNGAPVLCRIGTIVTSVSYLDEESEELIDIQSFCYLTQGNYSSPDTKYFIYKVVDRENRTFLKEYTGENVPSELKKLFSISIIEDLIPEEASPENKLADKNYVNENAILYEVGLTASKDAK